MRRAAEHDRPYLVDRVPWSFFLAATSLLILTLIDGLITVMLLDHGFEEGNPLMAALLDQGTGWFLVGKYLLTAIFLPVALVMNHYRLFGTRLRVGHFIPIVVLLYLLLIAYQGMLWSRRDETDSGRINPGAHTIRARGAGE